MGARILKALMDFTDLEHQRRSREVALEELRLHPAPYDRKVLAALCSLYGTSVASPAVERTCRLADLKEGMVLTRSIVISTGRPVLLAGLKLGTAHLELVRQVAELLDVQEPIHVQED